MRSLAEVERRSDEIKLRINQILSRIAEASTADSQDSFAGLAEEMALLLHESKVLATSMALARELQQTLVNAQCSGPH